MFERRVMAVLAIGAVIVAAPIRAQSVQALLAMKARNDSELTALEARRPAAPAAAQRAAEILDTTHVGDVTLVATDEAIPLLRSAITGAAVNVRHAFSDAGVKALARAELTGHLNLAPPTLLSSAHRGVLRLHLRVGTVEADLPVEIWPSDSVDATTDIEIGVSRAIRASLDSTMRIWMPVLRPPGADSIELGERAFRVAVTSGSAAVRRCLAGDDAQCKSALGLTPADDPLRAWYDPIDYPDLLKRVSNLHAQLETELGTPVVRACLDDHDIPSCTRVVTGIPLSALRPPMPDDVRSLLVLTAMQKGGDGAFDRLLADSTTPPLARLAAAARVPEHELLSEWRTRVMVSRPAKALPTAAITLVSLAWVAGCFALALRGTPWS